MLLVPRPLLTYIEVTTFLSGMKQYICADFQNNASIWPSSQIVHYSTASKQHPQHIKFEGVEESRSIKDSFRDNCNVLLMSDLVSQSSCQWVPL